MALLFLKFLCFTFCSLIISIFEKKNQILCFKKLDKSVIFTYLKSFTTKVKCILLADNI